MKSVCIILFYYGLIVVLVQLVGHQVSAAGMYVVFLLSV